MAGLIAPVTGAARASAPPFGAADGSSTIISQGTTDQGDLCADVLPISR